MSENSLASIAIVEDELIVALDIRNFLERSGYRVVGAYPSGDEFLRHFEELAPDLVLMDIKIKGSRDGVEVARIVHETWGTPTILLTAYADEATVARAKLSEPFGYILKPFEERELRTAIEIALYRAGMEQRLRASEERFRRLFQEGISGNFLSDAEGRLIEANPSFRRILEIPPEETLSPLSACFPDAAAWESFREGLRSQRHLESSELGLRTRGGRDILVLVNAALVATAGKELIQGELSDITERRRLELQLVQSQKMEAIGRLAGGIAHDFNNILTAVMGYATLLADESSRCPQIRDDVEGIRKATTKAAELTRQLLAFSRRQPTTPRLLDINLVLRDLEKMLVRLVSEDIRLRFSLDSSPAFVLADPTQMEQVVLNLVVNARDAMPRGGVLELGTRLTTLDTPLSLGIGVLAPGSYLLLTVRDTGTGIAQEDLPHIFEPFFTTKSKEQGTGLGLSTVYGIVKQAGGGIEVSTMPGKGTEFSVYLPTASGGASPETETREEKQGELGRRSILMVDDDDEVRALAVRFLEKRGHRVLSAGNAGEAFLLAESSVGPIDLLIADVVMPFMDGYRLAKRLRELRPGLRSLFISGFPERAFDAEAEGRFLPKPFTETSLLKAVEGAFLERED